MFMHSGKQWLEMLEPSSSKLSKLVCTNVADFSTIAKDTYCQFSWSSLDYNYFSLPSESVTVRSIVRILGRLIDTAGIYNEIFQPLFLWCHCSEPCCDEQQRRCHQPSSLSKKLSCFLLSIHYSTSAFYMSAKQVDPPQPRTKTSRRSSSHAPPVSA